MRDTDTSLPIDTDVINPLGYFATIWRNAEYEFKDKKIEKIKLEFINSIDEFMSKFTINTFSTHMGKNAIPIEWSEDNPSRYNDVRDLLNDLAYKVVINHAELIRIEKKWLL